MIEGGRAKAERVQIVRPTLVNVILRQGIKRQIRLMFFKIGYEVRRLRRTRIGRLEQGGLEPGQWRILSAREVALLTGGDKRRS
jgi:16S rRNA U516 pseudouridylate synthase RsuA-like enzyme